MNKLKILSTCLLLVILLSSCAESVQPDYQDGRVEVSQYNSQIFYGEWKVTDYIEGGRRSDKEQLQQYIGTTISYSSNSILINEQTVVKDPVYSCVLVSMENRHYFYGQNAPTNYWDILATDNEYFSYVFIDRIVSTEIVEDSLLLSGFTVKDDTTMTLSTDYGLLKLVRVNYPDDYQQYIAGP